MKENAPHGLLWRGFWEGLGAGLAAIALLWLTTRIPQWREPVVDAVFGLVPPDRLVWPTSIALCLGGVVGLVVAFVVSEYLLLRRLETGRYTIADIPKLDYRARLFRSIRDTK
jgi:hypothetical protein